MYLIITMLLNFDMTSFYNKIIPNKYINYESSIIFDSDYFKILFNYKYIFLEIELNI